MKVDIDKIQGFIEEHIIEDECDGIERTLVDFNYNDWIRFKKELKIRKKKNEKLQENS